MALAMSQDPSTASTDTSMGSNSMASGPGGKSTIKGLGQNVEAKTSGGCC